MGWRLRRRWVGRSIQVDILFDGFFIREFRAFQYEGSPPSRWIGHKHIIAAGLQEKAMFLAGLACLLLGYWFLITAIPRGRRLQALVPTSVGLVLGGLLWALWLGPLLLP